MLPGASGLHRRVVYLSELLAMCMHHSAEILRKLDRGTSKAVSLSLLGFFDLSGETWQRVLDGKDFWASHSNRAHRRAQCVRLEPN
jgi:hypothetical protein